MTPEGKIKKAFTDEARECELSYINLIFTGTKGDPDKLALPRGGVPAFIEFKDGENGELSEYQIRKIELYRSLDYAVFVIDNKYDAKALAWGLARGVGALAAPEEGVLNACRLTYRIKKLKGFNV